MPSAWHYLHSDSVTTTAPFPSVSLSPSVRPSAYPIRPSFGSIAFRCLLATRCPGRTPTVPSCDRKPPRVSFLLPVEHYALGTFSPKENQPESLVLEPLVPLFLRSFVPSLIRHYHRHHRLQCKKYLLLF